MIISPSFLLRIRNVSDTSSRRNENTFYVTKLFFFRKSCLYEIMWKNIVEQSRPQMTVWRTRIACWLIKGTHTHSDYVILIAFPLQRLNSTLCVNYPSCILLSLVLFSLGGMFLALSFTFSLSIFVQLIYVTCISKCV